MSLRFIPNLITGLRFALVPVLIGLLLNGRFDASLFLFFVMGASDAVDGFLAKRYGWHSRLGAILDPLADKTMLAGTYIALGWLGLLPIWLVIIVVARDILIMGGILIYQRMIRRIEMKPSYISKLNTFVQIILVLVVILQQLTAVPDWIVVSLAVATLVTTLASAADYARYWSARNRRKTADNGAI